MYHHTSRIEIFAHWPCLRREPPYNSSRNRKTEESKRALTQRPLTDPYCSIGMIVVSRSLYKLHNSSLQTKEISTLIEENYQNMRSTLQSCLRSDGTPRPATSPQQVITANRTCSPMQGSASTLIYVTRDDVKDYIIGDQVGETMSYNS